MPFIETVEELADEIADWCGVYGACSANGDGTCESQQIKCCRMGFTQEVADRIRRAVANDQQLHRLYNLSATAPDDHSKGD